MKHAASTAAESAAAKRAATRRRVALLSLTAAALAALAWWVRPSSYPNIVLITVDTLRADHIGAYGADDARTPNVDRLAAEGLVFDDATAPLPETRPAHHTLLTSLYPRDHGVLSNASRLVADTLTLPEVLRAAGFATGGVASCSLFNAAAGATLGFEDFRAPEGHEITADQAVPRALDWLAGLEPGRPFFLWLHLFDPHMPYEPPPPFNRAAPAARAAALPRLGWDQVTDAAGRHGGDLPLEVLERARELYRGEVEYVDHWLGRFFDQLRATGRLDGTIVLLTADHGECFENGVFFEHSQCLGEGALAVPLILRHSGVLAPGRIATPVELLDVAPTLLRLADLPVPRTFRGRGLLQRREADAPFVFFQHPVYPRWEAEQRRRWFGALRSVASEPVAPIVDDRLQLGARRGRWKYLRRGDRESLFDLAEDPGERVDRSASHPRELTELRTAVRRWMRQHPMDLGATDDVDPELLESLRTLGYL